jgi:hypothetical protein
MQSEESHFGDINPAIVVAAYRAERSRSTRIVVG